MTRPTAKAAVPPFLHPQTAGDVAEDVLHLVAEDDEDQDQRVLDHALTLVAGESVEESPK